ncbi:hypothetical protein CASFOL_022276 [Castilleja foliolosa]|uniref:Uncharacterized protein n=1 Tax=Castilleja foliolosa TaxID=1961234 RepID=A0ABD3CWS1_9LAMI
MAGEVLRSQGSYTKLNIFGFSIQEIWKSRCRAKFEDTEMNNKSIIKTVENCTR